MNQVFWALGIFCIVGVVTVSVIVLWFVKRCAPEQVERHMVYGGFLRMVLSILAVIFFVLSSIGYKA